MRSNPRIRVLFLLICLVHVPSVVIQALVPNPQAKLSYVHFSWRQIIVASSDSSNNDKYTIVQPTIMNSSLDSWKWLDVEEPPEWTQDSDPVAEIELECEASYPIEWIYEGDGWSEKNEEVLSNTQNLQEVAVKNSRISSNGNTGSSSGNNGGGTSDQFISRVTNVQLFEIISGVYKCRSINFPEVFVSFNIFVPNNTETFLGHLPPRVFLLESSQTIWFSEDDQNVRIPCSVSDPTAVVTLHELYDDGSDSGIRVDLPFDPRRGFFVPSKLISWKRYKCSIKDRRKNLEIFLFRESASKTPYFNVVPKETLVSLKVNQTQVFKCEGYRRISIETSGHCIGQIKTRYSYHAQNHYPYKAAVEVIPSNEDGFMEIVCRTEDGNQILQTWEFTKYDMNGLQLKFDEPNQQFLCCTNSQSGGRQPKISTIRCSSHIECLMRRQYHLNLNGHDTESLSNSVSPELIGCSALPFHGDYIIEGLFKCTLGTQVKENYFIYNGYRKYGALVDLKSKFNLSSQQDLASLEENVETFYTNDEAYRLPLGEVYVGEQQQFTCVVPKQLFATDSGSVQWLMKFKNGTFKQISVPKDHSYQAIIEFDDVNIQEVVCKTPYLNSFDWLTLQFPVEVRVTKILPAIEFRHNVVGVVDIVNQTIILNSTQFTMQKNLEEIRLELICQADYPIEWVYSAGAGTPIVKSAIYRDPKSFFGTKSGSVTAIITMNWNEQNTGKYLCRRTNDHSQNAFFDIYILGPKLFLHDASNTEKIFISPNDASFVIPCAVSNPNMQVKLLAELNTNTAKSIWSNVANTGTNNASSEITFSSIIGFTIPATEQHLAHQYFRVYKCISSDGKKSSSNFTVILNELQSSVTVIPYGHLVHITNTIDDTQLQAQGQYFECKANTDILIEFDNILLQSLVIVNYTQIESNTFKANFTISSRTVSNYTFIQCLERRTKKLLHYWEYTTYGLDLITSFDYSEIKKSYGCCTNSFHQPIIEYIPCSNVIECRIQKYCFQHRNCKETRGIRFDASTSTNDTQLGCVSFQIGGNFSEGILQCSVDGVTSRDSKVYMFYTSKVSLNNIGRDHNLDTYEIHTNKWNFDFNNKPIPTLAVLQMRQNLEDLFNDTNAAVQIECAASKFFLSNVFIFGLEHRNGSMIYNPSESKIKEQQSFYSASIRLMHSSLQDFKKIYCFTPEWKSLGSNSWRNASLLTGQLNFKTRI